MKIEYDNCLECKYLVIDTRNIAISRLTPTSDIKAYCKKVKIKITQTENLIFGECRSWVKKA